MNTLHYDDCGKSDGIAVLIPAPIFPFSPFSSPERALSMDFPVKNHLTKRAYCGLIV